MNQKLLDDLWERAKPLEMRICETGEKEDLHVVEQGCQMDGVDCMILRIMIEGNPEWHYCRQSPEGAWQSVSDCEQCRKQNK